MSAYTYPVSLDWPGGRRVSAAVEGKETIEIATPPEFKGTFPELWSPEDTLVAAVASCFGVTLIGLAERAGIPLHDLAIDALGRLGRQDRGPLLFTEIALDVRAETDPDRVEDLRAAAERAERGCLVSAALRIPVTLTLTVEPGRVRETTG